jgi:protoporphyrin/coproporphyrin ferrochelatase
MTRYLGDAGDPHGRTPAIGLLLSNLGTPQAPTAKALRPYLREFLSDPRVIELPRLLWLAILNAIVLTVRPRRSAALYRKVWTPEGSPLLAISRRQAAGLAGRLAGRTPVPVRVALGMRYGQPSLAAACAELAAAGCRKVLVLPLYPQYSATTTGSTFDATFAALGRRRWIPELRTIGGYHDEPGYVDALAASIAELWRRDGEPERLVLSFHGMPKRYLLAGDPYFCFCQKTARLVVDRLGIDPAHALVTFQSRFGNEEWLQPYTDETLRALPAQGVKSVDVVCPGFSADCLETLEEIDGLNREFFLHAGGERYRYVPCLDDRADHLDFLAGLVLRHLAGWTDLPAGGGDPAAEAARSRTRALARGAPAPGGAGAHPEG